ncbi:UNVERIFIED_CONTAM: hypothetical protein PYX00_001988 [Menopon gallinae]|uniref:Small integral membrane protein 12 n=1 Tax=Menopon gallinae TaxID=328185 RepID=A0AAW2IG58_9NEOP
MWPLLGPMIYSAVRNYLPIVTVPFAIIVGFIGYNIENLLSDKYTPSIKSALDERQERLLGENQEVSSLKEKKFVPKTIFERNLSPSLLEEDTRGERLAK